MKTVLFLGAGATRAQWDWEKEHGKLNPDIGKDCLPHFEPAIGKDFVELALCHCHSDWPEVRKYCSDAAPIDVEDLFTSIYQAAMDPDGDALGKKAWHHLLVCYRKLIGCTTKALTFPPGSPLPVLFKAILSDSDSSIVTTNQDFAAELCLADDAQTDGDVANEPTNPFPSIPTQQCSRQPRIGNYYVFEGLNTHEQGRTHLSYALDFDVRRIGRTREGLEPLRQLPSESLRTPVLKVHGSLNWWYASAEHFDPAPGWPDKPPYLMTDADIPVFARVNWDNPPKPHLYPLVVPFVKDKSCFFRTIIDPVLCPHFMYQLL